MKQKKPDRFERMVADEFEKMDTVGDGPAWLNGPDMVKLLRKQHKAVEQMVKKFPGEQYEYVGQEYGCLIDKGELLDQLKKRAT